MSDLGSSTTTEPSDAEPSDAEPSDAGASDAEPTDAEPSDAEASDAEPTNAEPTDAETSDGETTDAGRPAQPGSGGGPGGLNPAQQQVLDELGSTARPTFRHDLRADLAHHLEVALADAVADAPEPLYLSKHQLGLLHGCEARYVAERSRPFAWSVASARGAVAHKAIELLVPRSTAPTPLDLVDRAIERIEDDEQALGDFMRTLNDGQRAELAGRANDFVTTFMETFPPLDRRWKPVTEYSIRALLCDDRLTLRGKADLSLGYIRNGREAGKVLIDLKTGQPVQSHVEDLRFYALLETLKMGVPPRLLVNYYLDAGTPRSEVVTEDLLWSAARRVVDGVLILVEMGRPQGREPKRTVGTNCRWCPISDDCPEGSRHLARAEEDGWRPS